MAWYYHLYGSPLYAMTPQEEGYLSLGTYVKGFTDFLLFRLHATRYPWEHEEFTKTFDHQA